MTDNLLTFFIAECFNGSLKTIRLILSGMLQVYASVPYFTSYFPFAVKAICFIWSHLKIKED